MSAAEIAVEVVGFGGALLILGAYILLTLGKVTANSRSYQAMNFIGAIGFVINGYAHGAMPSAILNVIWAVIAIFALARITKRRRASRG